MRIGLARLASAAMRVEAGPFERIYDPSGPQGVRGRNSDNTRIVEELGWEPSVSLRDGLEKTYGWIFERLAASA